MDSSPLLGLTSLEAARRLQLYGANTLPESDHRGWGRILREVLREPMFVMLLITAGVYVVLGDRLEGGVMVVMAVVSVGLVVVQERRSEKVMETLRFLSQPIARVIRDGETVAVSSASLVVGDVVALEEGNHIAADAVLRQGLALQVDESILTGESVPIQKNVGDTLYSGCLIVRGHALAEVTATGGASRLGQIGKAVTLVKTEATPLQKSTGKVVRQMAVIGIGVSLIAAVLYAVLRHDGLGGLLAALSLAMALLPEEFPMVLAVFLAMGAWRLSQVGVLTRRSAAIETLGATTVLCVDKTGTLTENRMTIAQLWQEGVAYNPEFAPSRLAAYAALASRPASFDPMDRAAQELAERAGVGLNPAWNLVREYEIAPSLLAMSQVWRSETGESELVVAAKGAPEAVIDLCHLEDAAAQRVHAGVHQLASQGLRVLGVAEALTKDLTEAQHDFAFRFIGLIGFHDPLRPDVPQAVAECRQAGIRVMMITGDYADTAQVIAKAAGIESKRVLTGSEIAAMEDSALRQAVRETCVFARVLPEQKLKLVEALKADGEVVAMTGDGVNDAPALKAAHIGVAMGKRGSDVAREAASLVLLNDDFASLVASVRMGRRIHDNLLKAMSYIIAIHVPIAGLSLLPIFLGWPLFLLPVEIVFLELVIDPVCATVFEAEAAEQGVMHRPPQPPQEALFSRKLILVALARGAFLFVIIGVFYGVLLMQLPVESARAAAFTALVLSNLMMVLSVRSLHRPLWQGVTRPLLVISLLTVSLLGAALTIPLFEEIFHFGTLSLPQFAFAVALGIIPVAVLDFFKRYRYGSYFASST